MRKMKTIITTAIIIPCLAFFSCTPPSNRNNSETKNTPSKNESTPTTSSLVNGNETNKNIQPPAKPAFAGPTAVEIGEVLKRANVFPKTNQVTDTTTGLTEADRNEGAVSSAVIESSEPAGVAIKVFHSIDERNQARLRMIKDCPGCVAITECGAILMYEPYTKADDINKILRQKSQEYYGVLKRQYKCE